MHIMLAKKHNIYINKFIIVMNKLIHQIEIIEIKI